MRKNIFKRVLIFDVLFLFIVAGISPSIISTEGIIDSTDISNGYLQKTGEIENLCKLQKETRISSNRNVLKGNDEGPHQNMIFEMEEWWYYNVYLNDENSDLKNWFILISFQLYESYSFGGLKLELYDNENETHGGDNFDNITDITSHGPGVNYFIINSSAIGRYPDWHIYAEYINNDKCEIVVNLTFKANSLPIWLVRNTGHNCPNSFFGYYCVMNCIVFGNVSINGTFYNVSGLGYHDHTWAPMNWKIFKLITKEDLKNWRENNIINLLEIWDWLCIHFDNGWDMFVGKIFLEESYLTLKYVLGNICFTTNGINFYESYLFLLNYEEFQNSSEPNVKFPVKVHIRALVLNTKGIKGILGPIVLDFYYEAKNTREDKFGNLAYWVSHGKIYGSGRGFLVNIPLYGWAVFETTTKL